MINIIELYGIKKVREAYIFITKKFHIHYKTNKGQLAFLCASMQPKRHLWQKYDTNFKKIYYKVKYRLQNNAYF